LSPPTHVAFSQLKRHHHRQHQSIQPEKKDNGGDSSNTQQEQFIITTLGGITFFAMVWPSLLGTDEVEAYLARHPPESNLPRMKRKNTGDFGRDGEAQVFSRV
jgi:hypothetical protein